MHRPLFALHILAQKGKTFIESYHLLHVHVLAAYHLKTIAFMEFTPQTKILSYSMLCWRYYLKRSTLIRTKTYAIPKGKSLEKRFYHENLCVCHVL